VTDFTRTSTVPSLGLSGGRPALSEGAWRSTTAIVIAAGVGVGFLYVLSPFTVLFLLVVVPVILWAGRGLSDTERRWLFAILVAAVGVRVLLVLGLFLTTNHDSVPFGSLFGDEEYFIRRSLWMRNIAIGLPVHRADFIYAYDDYSRTSYLYVLATLQVLLGAAPYGAHLFSILCWLAASVILYRLVRQSYGRLPAMAGLGLLLFLPSLFAWSISALKESLYFLVMSVGLAAAVTAGRPGRWPKRVGALVVVVATAVAAQSIRDAGFAMAGIGAMSGIAIGIFARRPRLLLATVMAFVVVAPVVLTRGRVQDRIVTGVRQAVAVHWGHVNTPGYVYTIFDGGFYMRRSAISSLTVRQGVQYVIGSLVTYVIVPLPWKVQSQAALSYLPEQVVWYLMVLLAPVGLLCGIRRDTLLTALLATYAATAAALVAVTSGNVGTLVRHRGLAVPYLMWLSVLGACQLVAWFTASQQDLHADHR
jgi:hypothetical protein